MLTLFMEAVLLKLLVPQVILDGARGALSSQAIYASKPAIATYGR